MFLHSGPQNLTFKCPSCCLNFVMQNMSIIHVFAKCSWHFMTLLLKWWHHSQRLSYATLIMPKLIFSITVWWGWAILSWITRTGLVIIVSVWFWKFSQDFQDWRILSVGGTDNLHLSFICGCTVFNSISWAFNFEVRYIVAD